MKVILLSDVKGTGKKDQILEVSDGFARNYLLPRKLAVAATADALGAIQTAKKAQEHKKSKEKEAAVALAKRIGEMTLTVSVRAGENGRLFGSLTTQEIADTLLAQHGVEIDKRKVSLEEPVKAVGDAVADLKLYPEVTAKLKLNVVAKA